MGAVLKNGLCLLDEWKGKKVDLTVVEDDGTWPKRKKLGKHFANIGNQRKEDFFDDGILKKNGRNH